MKIKLDKKLLLIFVLALLLRVYKLGQFPEGFHVDEVKVGWNAYSILKTGLDDRGNKLTLYYNSFGDFRPTGIFYLTIPSIIIFGLNEFAVRFPSALIGALTVFPLYFLTKEFARGKTKKDDKTPSLAAIISALLLALNPWHISTSRATSEVIISTFFSLSGLFLFLKGLNQKKTKPIIAACILLAISYFFYHSIRLLAPMFLFTIIAFYWRSLKPNLKKCSVFGLLFISLFTLILISDKEARGRFSQVSIFSDLDVQYELSRMPFEEGPNKVFIARLFHNKPLVYARRFVNEYAKYFSSNFFLVSTEAKPARYQTIGVGLLTYIELTLFIFGLIAIAQKKFSVLPLLLLLVSPFAAALTTEDSPNLHRAMLMLPFVMVISSYGVVGLRIFSKKYLEKILYTILALLTLNFVFFIHMYFVHNRVHIPLYRNVGAKELALYLNEVKDNYDQIIITNIPDDPYPWIAFFTKSDPKTFNQSAILRSEGVWAYKNLTFTGQRCPSRDAFTIPRNEKLLVVDAEACAKESKLHDRSDVKLVKTIFRPDDSEVYTLWSNVID